MPADISVEFKVYETHGYKLTLIGEPLQSHVVAWEQASRAIRNEDAKPILNRIMAMLRDTSVADITKMASTLSLVSEALETALQIVNDNETLTLSANVGVMVKAAIQAGWIVSLTKSDEPVAMLFDSVDSMKPWLVHWIAEQVASLYMEATSIPKN